MTQPLVLIVDDEPAIRRLLRTSLLAQGYRTVEAESGAAAMTMAMAATEKPDILLLDLGLPDMDGLEVIRLVRAASAAPAAALRCGNLSWRASSSAGSGLPSRSASPFSANCTSAAWVSFSTCGK